MTDPEPDMRSKRFDGNKKEKKAMGRGRGRGRGRASKRARVSSGSATPEETSSNSDRGVGSDEEINKDDPPLLDSPGSSHVVVCNSVWLCSVLMLGHPLRRITIS